jgi:lincosamide nucleotidyltransferase A/C/D/E
MLDTNGAVWLMGTGMPKSPPGITAQEVVHIVRLLDQHNIEVWVDGGWGVDALLGKQTRNHADLDIAIKHADVPTARRILEERGYRDVPREDTKDWNFVLGDQAGHLLDVHSFTFDDAGKCIYGCAYPADSLAGSGVIAGQRVKCISAEWMVEFHSGYVLDADDYRDVLALCNAFGISLPAEYDRVRGHGPISENTKAESLIASRKKG